MIETISNSSAITPSAEPLAEIKETKQANVAEISLDAKAKRRGSNCLRRKMRAHICHQKNIKDLHGLDNKELRALLPERRILREKAAILRSPKLKELLGNEKIVEIKKDEQGYLVLTQNLSLRVEVENLASTKGHRPFALHFKEAMPRN